MNVLKAFGYLFRNRYHVDTATPAGRTLTSSGLLRRIPNAAKRSSYATCTSSTGSAVSERRMVSDSLFKKDSHGRGILTVPDGAFLPRLPLHVKVSGEAHEKVPDTPQGLWGHHEPLRKAQYRQNHVHGNGRQKNCRCYQLFCRVSPIGACIKFFCKRSCVYAYTYGNMSLVLPQ